MAVWWSLLCSLNRLWYGVLCSVPWQGTHTCDEEFTLPPVFFDAGSAPFSLADK
jgi:hypothetical protein